MPKSWANFACAKVGPTRLPKSWANCACLKVGPTSHAQRLGQLACPKVGPTAHAQKLGRLRMRKISADFCHNHSSSLRNLTTLSTPEWKCTCAKGGPTAHAQKLGQLRVRKSWDNCTWAKVRPTAHAQKLGQLRMRKNSAKVGPNVNFGLLRMRNILAKCACAKAYHLEGEAAVLHVFSVKGAVLQLSLLPLLLFSAPLRVRSEDKSKRFFKGSW